jgi:hypothetical protein
MFSLRKPKGSLAKKRTLNNTRQVPVGAITHSRTQEYIMPSANDIARWTREYFQQAQQRTVHVLAGPKRETWFSAELFVALSSQATPHAIDLGFPSFAIYGEQEYATVFTSVLAASPTYHARRRPDIVVYEPGVGINAILAVIELKVVLEGENPARAMADLDIQLRAARLLAPNATVLGLVFLAAVPFKTPGTFARTRAAVRQSVEAALPATDYDWVAGYDLVDVFPPTPTEFLYPALSVPLAIGIRELRPLAPNLAPHVPQVLPAPAP